MRQLRTGRRMIPGCKGMTGRELRESNYVICVPLPYTRSCAKHSIWTYSPNLHTARLQPTPHSLSTFSFTVANVGFNKATAHSYVVNKIPPLNTVLPNLILVPFQKPLTP